MSDEYEAIIPLDDKDIPMRFPETLHPNVLEDVVRRAIVDDLVNDGPIAQAMLKLVTKDIRKDGPLRRTLLQYLR